MERRPTTAHALALLATGGLVLSACSETAPNPVQPEADQVAVQASHSASPGTQRALSDLRRETAPFHNLKHAMAAGYDVEATGCLDNPGVGGMGFHYTKSATNLIDGTVDLLEPEFLVFSPHDGGVRFTAVEYVVPFADWSDPQPPSLLGQSFHAHPVLPVWILHIWVWRDNPLGMFADFNPKVELCN